MCRIMGEASLRLFFFFLVFVFTGTLSAVEISDDGVWQRADERRIAASVARDSIPQAYRTFSLNREMLQNVLRQAPLEFTSAARTSNVVLSLPLPDGSFSRYRIEESPVMEPELAAQFPQIKTYRGQGIDDPFGVVRFGWTAGGLHAIGFSEHDSFFISVLAEGDTGHYISYWSADSPQPANPVKCLTQEHESIPQASSSQELLVSGSTLRTYTVAIGATGEYTSKFGGTKDGALNDGIIPSMNQLNAILEREFAIRLVVTGEQMKTIYTDPSTDPYSGSNSQMATQNQANLDSEIGPADYDVGHVFHGFGGSGIAQLGTVCGSSKAWATSASGTPKNMAWIVELVAHEFGHQFSAHHTFNGTTTNCNGNRNGSTAWEPGSGSTIMSYSGSCSGENLQTNSDPYYHVGSYDQVLSLITGNTCDTETATGNNPPTVNAGPDFTIPKSTPFTLTASANDADGDALTYSWEEWDLGAASPPNTDDGSRPIFRSFAPVSSPSRTFPKLSDILNNVSTLGESLPTTDRALKFRITARDNRASFGGVANDMTVITVENNAGPFQVTSPNTAVTLNGGTQQTVTWNVAGTNGSPVNTANVNILLSTDGGLTFPTSLAASTPNDGTQSINIPNTATTSARIKVAAVGNIYFDISNVNFTISTGGCTPITLSPASLPAGEVGTAYNQTISASGGTAPYTFAVTSGSLPTGLTLGAGGTLSGNPSAAGTFNFTVTSTDDNDCTGNKSYSINVTTVACAPITVSPSSLPAGEVGTPYNQTISASGGTAPYTFAVTSGTVPTGLTLGPGGTLSGNPSAAGTFNFTVTSTDDNDCTGNKSYSINVTTVACAPITVSPASLPAGEVGTPYNQTISASGGTAPYTFAVTSGTVPTGLTLGPGGNLSGNPSAAGTFNFTVTSTDDNDCTGNKSYSINVTTVACAPITVSPSSLPAGQVGTPYNQTISASGGTAPYTFAVTSGTVPTGLTLGPGGNLSGNPSAAGTFNFTVTSTDDNDCTGNKSYSINVTTVACAPITLSPSSLPAGQVGTPYNQTISASGGTAPYSFARTSGSLPTGLTLGPGGLLSGTPSAAGTFNFTVTSTDDIDCTGNKSYSINVTTVNTCLFCDDFDDNVLSTAWTYSQSVWSETGGRLIGTSPKKAMALATPAFGGCSNCYVETRMRTSGGEGNRVWMFGWYVDKTNEVELLMKEESDVWILKQKWNGSTAKVKANAQINPGVGYVARISFDGTQFQVFINGTLLITMPKLIGSSPNGTIGFQTKGTTATIEKIEVK